MNPINSIEFLNKDWNQMRIYRVLPRLNIGERSTKYNFEEFNLLAIFKTINCALKCLVMLDILPCIFSVSANHH